MSEDSWRPLAGISAPILANILRGDLIGNAVLAPGPSRPLDDRSLTVTIQRDAPAGFLIISRTASRDEARRHVLDRIRAWRSRSAPQADLFEAAL